MLIILLSTFVATALAGTQCPPRENIYPCSCLSVPKGKNIFFTSITCHRLPSTDAFSSIFPALRTTTIDHFYLYDSFWEASHLKENEDQQVLPADWLTLLRIKEIEIVDTTLSSCFPCHSTRACRNDFTTRFTVDNSSSHDKICTICEPSKGQKFSWTFCMKRLEQFHFRHGKLTVIGNDLFPLSMNKLTEVDLSYNSITDIEPKALQNLPKLKVLRLSHNALQTLNGFSKVKLGSLQELDVSWNMLSSLSAGFFTAVPNIKTLIASHNDLIELEEKQWKDSPGTLRVIDLRENPIHCDCSIRWVNSTFHINTVIQGHCAGPEDYEDSLIRKASRMLIERCTEDGKIGTRKPKTTTKATF